VRLVGGTWQDSLAGVMAGVMEALSCEVLERAVKFWRGL
jgi:hypothetical protein